MVKIHTLSLQAESMITAAKNNGKNFERSAMAFLKTANESGQQGNALVAYCSEMNKAKNENLLVRLKGIFVNKATVDEVFTDKFDYALKANEELSKEFKTFYNALKSKYNKSLADRYTLADYGAVRADGVHRHTFREKFWASISKMIREE